MSEEIIIEILSSGLTASFGIVFGAFFFKAVKRGVKIPIISQRFVSKKDAFIAFLISIFLVGWFSNEIDVKLNKILIRTQKTKWASCSLKRNLSFNLKLISLPDRLIKYIVYHELLHLKEKKHNYAFMKLLELKFKNYKSLEKMLFRYWFVLDKNKIWKNLM